MDDIIGVLLYNSFQKLQGLNQTFEEKQGLFSLPGHVKQGEKYATYYCVANEDLRKFKGKSKENSVTV